MSNEQVNLRIGVTADTSQAKQELQSLQTSISNLITAGNKGDPLKSLKNSLGEAGQKTAQLASELAKATNPSGGLDTAKLAKIWKANGQSLESYGKTLRSLGPDGEAAFKQLASAIYNAQTPVRTLDGLLGKFMKGLGNVAVWTVQSNAIHAFQSALQGAFSYAEKLNKGLTDIAIVSDLTGNQLADFAKTANQMAKDLSASTSEVVSGALIYYQAGLSDEEVIERTETTIKLAQTSGESAEQISSYMTAIWNNFYDGAESVEYYADAISYLGAVTAASNADIAEGIQSFAATADTVGLSFEYGAAALTVLRDVTQQSASTIGNSLKTIFARLEGLKLGETLEDGVDLNKYTKALQSVGVEVLDVNGELKNADTILDDLASRWETLNNAQKVALAQTVGGVRQYNNLISLMDNYERFQELVAGAKGSEGYLQKQADVYAESWEAAQNRVKAAWEGMYDILIDDKAIIKLTNALASTINLITSIVDKAGGLGTLLPLIISWLSNGINNNLTQINRQIIDLVDNTFNFKNNMQEADNLVMQSREVVFGFNAPVTENDQDPVAQRIYQLQDAYLALTAKINDAKKEGVEDSIIYAWDLQAQGLLVRLKAVAEMQGNVERVMGSNIFLENHGEQIFAAGQRQQLASSLLDSLKQTDPKNKQDITDWKKSVQEQFVDIFPNQQSIARIFDKANTNDSVETIREKLEKALNKANEILQDRFDDILKENGLTDEEINAIEDKGLQREAKEDLAKVKQEFDELVAAGKESAVVVDALDKIGKSAKKTGENIKDVTAKQKDFNKSLAANAGHVLSAINSMVAMTNSLTSLYDGLEKARKGGEQATEGFQQMGSAVLALAGVFVTLLRTFNSSDFILNLIGGASHVLPWVIGITAALVVLVAIFRQLKKAQEDAFSETVEGRLQTNNELLDEQTKLVKDLASAYSNLESTLNSLTSSYDKLNEVAEKYGKNSPQYALALAEYNEKVKELRDLYGDDVFDKEGEVWVINENKLAEAQLQRYNTAKLELQFYENADKKLQLEKSVKDLTTFGAERYNSHGNIRVNGVQVKGKLYSDILSKFQEAIDENGNLVNEKAYEEASELIGQLPIKAAEYFRNLMKNYTDAFENAQNLEDPISFFQNQLQQNGVYEIADQFNIDREKFDNYFNNTVNERVDRFKDNETIINAARENWADTHNYTINGDGTITDSEGNAVENVPEAAELVRLYVTQGLITALNNPDSSEFKNMLNSAGITGSMQAEFEKMREEYLTEQIRTQGAKEDINNNANGFNKKELASIESLVEELKTGELYADKFSKGTLETEGSVKKLAFAMKQADQGIQEWTKSWYDWEDAIKNSERGSFEYIEAMDEIKDSSADLLGITDELSAAGMTLGSTFGEYVEKNLDTVYKAFSGSQEAALEMQKWAAEDMANQLQSAQDLSDSELANVQDSIAAHMDVMAAMLDSGDLKFGRVDDSELLGSLENIINSIATTKDEAEALLAAMGYDAEVEEEHDTVKRVQMRWIPQEFSTDSVPVGINGTDTFSFITSLGELGHWDPVEIEEPKTVTALKIKTADYVGGGNITTSKGGGGTRAPKKTGGGGGGKKQKTKEKDTTRYHEITQRLEQNQHALNMLNAQEDRAYGQKKLDMMDQKLKLLQQQAELYEQLAKEAKNYYDNDRERLHNEYGAAFNPDGTIKDYDSWYGSFVDKYNAGQMSDDEWKKFEDAIKKYEESLKKMNEAEEKLQKNLFEQYDIKLEKVEYKLKTITKLIEMDMEYLDYMINMLDDDGLDTAEAIGYLAREIDDITKKYEANKEALEGIFKNHEGITDEIIADLFSGAITVDEFIEKVGDFTEKEIESLQSIMSSMFQNGQDLKKYIESLYDKLNELSDKFQASIDKAIDKLNHMNNMIEKTRNIIDIMGKDTLGISDELLNRMQRAQIEIGKEHVATLQQELDQYRAWLAEEEALYATMNPDSLEARALRDVIENYKKTIMSLEEEILDTAADTAEKIKQIYRDMIQQAVDEMGKQISGRVGDFEKLLDLYEKQKNLDDRYLDTYEKTYQTNKLLRDIRKSLDDTDNLRTQELLRDLQGEILDMQKEGVQVAEEQLQERRLYYELLLAEAALQEAQDAKNMVRMTRDSEGNWSYTYTADQGKVDDLRQRYDDALHAYEEFNENTLQTMQDTLLQMQEEYSNALAEAQTEDEVRALAEYYEPMIDHQRQMIDYFITRNNELVENFNVNADQVSTKLDDTVYGMVTGFGSMDEAAQAMDEAYDEVKDHVIDYLGQMEKEQQELAATVHVTEPEINADLDKIEQGVADVNKEVDKVSEEFNEEFGDAMGTLADFHAKIGPIIDGIIGELGNITSTVGDVITAYSKLSHTPVTAPDLSAPIGAFRALEAAAEAAAAAAKKAANAGSPLDTGSEPVDYGKRAYPQTSYGAWWSGFTEYRTGGYVGHGAKSIIGAATGMYTGAWGEEGKLAVLHEKELVLNKHDTENMLKTVGFVRDLTQMISLNASVAGQGLGNLFLGGVSQGGGFLDQNVTIHAEFPNATNHTEIEEAFNNLIGLASQYAGRKK